MAMIYRRIYRNVLTTLANLIAKQIGVESIADPDCFFKMWGGKDGDGVVTKWLAKDQMAKVSGLKVSNGAEIRGLLSIGDPEGVHGDFYFYGNDVFKIIATNGIYIHAGSALPVIIGSAAEIDGSIILPISAVKTGAYLITESDHTILCDDNGLEHNAALTLPAASGCSGRIYHIHIYGGNGDNHFVISPDGSDRIERDFPHIVIDTGNDGNPTFMDITLQSDGVSNWLVIGWFYSPYPFPLVTTEGA